MILVGIGEYAITDILDEKIVTHALGSCVALIMHCPKTKCTAMAHIVLPEQDVSHKPDVLREAYFADDIVPKLIKFFRSRTYCSSSKLKVLMIGGAVSSLETDVFKVGQRNVRKIKSILDDHNLKYDASEVLGRFSRTVEVQIDTGKVIVKKQEMFF